MEEAKLITVVWLENSLQLTDKTLGLIVVGSTEYLKVNNVS